MPVGMYRPGDWWVVCDQCGRKGYASQMTKRWDGLIVHAAPEEGCYETRHPQEFVRSVKDNAPLPFIRTERELDATLAVNCAGHYPRAVESLIEEPIKDIYKGYSTGPVAIATGVVVTVFCTWTIE